MRILQFISSAGFFGAENVVLQLAIALDKLGTDVIVGIVNNLQNPHLELVEECNNSNIRNTCFVCRGKIDHKIVRNLRRFIVDENIDVIHSHGYKSNIYAFLASIGTAVKLVSTCHNWIGNDPKMRFYSKLDRFILRRFSYIVAVSSEVKALLLTSKIRGNNLEIIDNGININTFCGIKPVPELLEELSPLQGSGIVLGTVGRISEEKGHAILLKAFREIRKRHPKTKLLLVGDGPLKKALETEFTETDIVFLGNRRDVSTLYGIMDIFVLPSFTEGLPMVILEAMASGKAIISSSVGEIPNIIEDGISGLLVNPGSEIELQKAISLLLSTSGLIEKLGNKAREIVIGRYSAESMGQAYLKVYQKII